MINFKDCPGHDLRPIREASHVWLAQYKLITQFRYFHKALACIAAPGEPRKNPDEANPYPIRAPFGPLLGCLFAPKFGPTRGPFCALWVPFLVPILEPSFSPTRTLSKRTRRCRNRPLAALGPPWARFGILLEFIFLMIFDLFFELFLRS